MIRRPTMTIAILAMWSLCAAVLAAADPAPRDDEAVFKVAQQAFGALKAGNWQKFASLMHSEALRDFKQALAPSLESADTSSEEFKEIMSLFGNPKDVKELLALPPEKFFARLLQG